VTCALKSGRQHGLRLRQRRRPDRRGRRHLAGYWARRGPHLGHGLRRLNVIGWGLNAGSLLRMCWLRKSS
jgi:hypothetical protein